MDLSAGAAIREDALPAAAASTPTDYSFCFTFGHISHYCYDNCRTSYLCIYLAASGPVKQPSRATSGSKQAHNWGGGSVSKGCDPRRSGVCCWCLLLPVLLLVLAASSAAAAASTTTAFTFLRLVTFRTGMIKFLPGIQCVRIRRTWVLILPFFVFIILLHPAMQQACVAWLVLVDLDG